MSRNGRQTRRRYPLGAALAAAATVLLFAGPLRAADVSGAGAWGPARATAPLSLRAVDAVWTNGTGDMKWNTAGNWNGNMVPQEGVDRATINIGNTTCTLDAAQNLNAALDRFLVDGATTTNVNLRDVAFAMNGPAELKRGRVLLDNVTWGGMGTLTNTIPQREGIALRVTGRVAINSPFVQNGALQLYARRTNDAAASADAVLFVDRNFSNGGHMLFTEQGNGIGRSRAFFGFQVLVPQPAFTNTGKIDVENGPVGEAVYHRIEADTITNRGTITLAADSRFALLGDEVRHTGTLTIGKGSVALHASLFRNQNGGVVEGRGTLKAGGRARYSAEGGMVKPGVKRVPAARGPGGEVHPDELGQLTFDGGYEQDAEGSLDIQIGGTLFEPEDDLTLYDRLAVVNGPTLLDGTLSVMLVNGFLPEPDDTFDILVADGSLIGSFANVDCTSVCTLSTPDGTWTVQYLRNSESASLVRLTGFKPIPEPATLALLATAAGALPRRRRGSFSKP